MEIRVDLSAIAQRRLGVEIAVPSDPAREHDVEFLLPVWTPGSYLIREYSRHLRDVVAVDGVSGVPLEIRKTRKNRYCATIPKGCTRVVLRYSVYAHSLTVRESWVGEEFAYWNGACVYLWPVDQLETPATVRVDLPPDWELYFGGGAIERLGNRRRPSARFEVSGLEHAVDSPCLALTGAKVIAFEALGVPHQFVCAGLGAIEPPVEKLVQDTKKVIEEAAAVFGVTELPFDDYTFLSLFSANGRGGLEHANSSTLLAPRTTFTPFDRYHDFVSLVAHEFFHVWNVKRLKPVEFHDFDYERETYTTLLWVAEGFTAYYDDHICLRAGISDAVGYLETIAKHIDNAHRMPGRFAQSLSESSFDAWIRFYRQDENTRNITQNYYANGALAALCIDAAIRRSTDGAKCLDDVMRVLLERHLENGYTHDDVLKACSDVAGESLEARIHSLVCESFDPDLDEMLETYGLKLTRKSTEVPRLGLQFQSDSLRIAVVIDDGVAWRAGLAPGDEILAIDRVRVRSGNWTDIFQQLAKSKAVGNDSSGPSSAEVFSLCVVRDGMLRDITLDIHDAGQTGSFKITADPSASEAQLRRRQDWLGTTANKLG